MSHCCCYCLHGMLNQKREKETHSNTDPCVLVVKILLEIVSKSPSAYRYDDHCYRRRRRGLPRCCRRRRRLQSSDAI